MKLYFSPGACSFAPHIVLNELGIPFTPVKVDLRAHKLADGTDFYSISPNGYVPILELDDGTRLAEAAVVLQYLADRKPGTLAPAFGSFERYKLMETLNFIATEIHKGFSPLWYPETPGSDENRDGREAGQALRRLPTDCSAIASSSSATRSRSRMRTCSRWLRGPTS